MSLVASQQGAAPILNPGERRQCRRWCAGDLTLELPHPSQELIAVLLRHADVAEDDVRFETLFQTRERLAGAPGGGDIRASIFQQALHEFACVEIVVENEGRDARENWMVR